MMAEAKFKGRAQLEALGIMAVGTGHHAHGGPGRHPEKETARPWPHKWSQWYPVVSTGDGSRHHTSSTQVNSIGPGRITSFWINRRI
jgi:hypothetical protein